MAAIPAVPDEHDIFPAFSLPDHEGTLYDPGVLRQHRNLVLIFIAQPDAEAADILRDLASASDRIDAAEGTVITILGGSSPRADSVRRELELHFTVLADEDGALVRQMAPDGPKVFVTDRFREVFLVRRARKSSNLVDEIIARLEFIEHQCPE